ncbi:hypothetical protein DIPPA_05945 [Diplonema papillatum]|nr:hypothetical protein DIPPA_05945 [Diplonema papillatum]
MPKKVKNGGGGGGGGPDGMTKNEAKRYYKVQLTGRLRDMLEKGRADALSKSDKKGSLEQTVHSWLRPEPGSNFLDNSFNMRDVIVQAAKDCRHEGLLAALRRIYGDPAVDSPQ